MYLELNIVVQVGVVMISQTLTLKSCKISGLKYLVMLRITKGVMQGKLIAIGCTLRTYWNQFSLGGICKQE